MHTTTYLGVCLRKRRSVLNSLFINTMNANVVWVEPIFRINQGLPFFFKLPVSDMHDTNLAYAGTIYVCGLYIDNIEN